MTIETKLRRNALRARKAEDGLLAVRQELRAAIKEARKSGMTLEAIGRAAGGLSRERVRQLLQD